MSDHPLITVCIPVYNAGAFIERCLDSVRAQNFQRVSIAVVDDGSTDDSAARIEAWSRKNPEISLSMTKQTHRGIAPTFNRLLRSATGRYIAWLDADDELTDGSLQSRFDFLQSHPDRLAVFGDAVMVDNNGSVIAESVIEKKGGHRERMKTDAGLRQELILHWCLVGSVLFTDTAVFEKIGAFDERYGLQDFPIFLRLLAGNFVAFLDAPVCRYRLHGKNHSYQIRNRIQNLRDIAEEAQAQRKSFSKRDQILLLGLAAAARAKARYLSVLAIFEPRLRV